jgi:hypothetical protein
MTLADYSLTAFALLNGGRTAAYFPQFIRVYRDPHGAAAVSLMTWGLFTAANVATVSYALTITNDHVVAIVFALNAIGCLAICGVTAFKRFHDRDWATRLSQRIASLRQSYLLVNHQLASSRHPGNGSSNESHRDRMLRELLM